MVAGAELGHRRLLLRDQSLTPRSARAACQLRHVHCALYTRPRLPLRPKVYPAVTDRGARTCICAILALHRSISRKRSSTSLPCRCPCTARMLPRRDSTLTPVRHTTACVVAAAGGKGVSLGPRCTQLPPGAAAPTAICELPDRATSCAAWCQIRTAVSDHMHHHMHCPIFRVFPERNRALLAA